jgi:3-oxoacyl-ACP reductase-like protein
MSLPHDSDFFPLLYSNLCNRILNQKNMQRFSNKTALITGGTNGMGFATAQKWIEEGGKVIITGRSKETLNKALENWGRMLQELYQMPEI